MTAGCNVVQELESLKYVLQTETECLVSLLPSHHGQRGGFLCEEVSFGGAGQPADVSQDSRMAMLCQVFGKKLHPSTFSELIVNEHGKLALTPFLSLRKSTYTSYIQRIIPWGVGLISESYIVTVFHNISEYVGVII